MGGTALSGRKNILKLPGRTTACGEWLGKLAGGYMTAASIASLVFLACAPEARAQVPTTPPVQPSGQFVQQTPRSTPDAPAVDFQTDAPFSASYVGADAVSVVNEILGEFLKIDYSVAPDVSGIVTMRLDNVQTRLTAIDALRAALRPMGIAVIDRGNFVAVARASEQGAPVQAGVLTPGQPSPPGGGLVVMTPRYANPSQLAPLVAPFAPGATLSLVDDNRRFFLIRGDEGSITAASTAAAMFDVDWFAQVTVATFDLKNLTPADLVAELKPVLGPAIASVDFIPVPRLAKLIVLARDPQVVPAIKGWIERLDIPSSSLSPGLLVYRARNSNAQDLAKSVQDTGAGSEVASAATSSDAPTTGKGTAQSSTSQAFALPTFGASGQSLSVTFNEAQNAVVVRGSSSQLAEAKALLEALDLPTPQVLIEAAIIEVTLDDELQFGINWRGLEKRFIGTFTDAPTGRVTSTFPGFALTYVNTDIEAALNVLSSITKVEVVSRPSLMALNNQTANLQVGDQVPIVTQTAISVSDPDAPIVNQTVYRDTGVILEVTPRVRAGGMVELEVAQEVSQVARTTSSGIDSPTIQQRAISSKLLVPSGQSVALGGLISTNRSGSVTGIPLLMDIPLLGHLFRSDGRITERTELVVFMTPRVLNDGQASVEATDKLRAAFTKLEQELGRR